MRSAWLGCSGPRVGARGDGGGWFVGEVAGLPEAVEGGGVVPEAGGDQGFGEFFVGLEVSDRVGALFFEDSAVSSLAAVGEAIEGVDLESKFSGGLNVMLVQVWVGVVDAGERVDELVGGEGLCDFVSVGVEVFDVAGDGGRGALHALRRSACR